MEGSNDAVRGDGATVRVAAIDVGTNTTRMLVAEKRGKTYRDLDRRLVFTRLGEGVDARRTIDAAAIKRTLRAITEFCAVSGEYGAERIRIAGTSAVRDAANRDTFLSAVTKVAGVEPHLLSGADEARLSFLGATAELFGGLHLVCDIGGGSTEFVIGHPAGETEGRISLDIGSVRLTERFLRSDPAAAEEMLTMEAQIDEALAKVEEAIPNIRGARFVGVAGTVTTLAALHLGLEEYDPEATHHLILPRAAVRQLYISLAGMTVKQRSGMASLPAGRADIIVAGASILYRAMAQWGLDEVIVSEKDILDGLVIEMLGET